MDNNESAAAATASAALVHVDYDLDPAAVEWARGKVQWAIDKADHFADQGGDNADQWRRMARIFHLWLLGEGEGCVITPLDTRLPQMKALAAGPA